MQKLPHEKILRIIPKPKPTLPLPFKILLWGMIALFIISVGGYFGLKQKSKELEKRKNQLQLTLLQTQNQTQLPENLYKLSQKIKFFSEAIKQHKKPSTLIDFIKSLTHPKITLDLLEIDVSNNKIFLSGTSENFQALGEQVLVFSRINNIKGLEVSNISLNREGKVTFSLAFYFPSELVK